LGVKRKRTKQEGTLGYKTYDAWGTTTLGTVKTTKHCKESGSVREKGAEVRDGMTSTRKLVVKKECGQDNTCRVKEGG